MLNPRTTACFVLCGVGLSLSACSWLYGQTTTAGARPFPMDYEDIDLVKILDPDGIAASSHKNEWKSLGEGQRIDLAYAQYRSVMSGKSAKVRVESRNEIQDRILGASDQLCAQYKQYASNVYSTSNFGFGVLTTGAAAAAAVVSGGSSQFLAAAAAGLSGTRAESNQDFFYDQAVPEIFKGIDRSREKYRNKDIYRHRLGLAPSDDPNSDDLERLPADFVFDPEQSIARYTLQNAVGDALIYHSKCSMAAGIQELGVSLNLAQNPGLDAMKRVLYKANTLRDVAVTGATSDAELSQKVAESAGSRMGTLGPDPSQAYASTQLATATALQSFNESVSKVQRLGGTTDANGKKYSDIVRAAAVTRTEKANGQLEACQPKIIEAADAIAKARLDAAKAGAGDSGITARAALESKIVEGRSRVLELQPAIEGLNVDLDSLLGAINAANDTADKAKADKLEAASIHAIVDRITQTPTAGDTLPCAPPPAVAPAALAPVVAAPTAPQ